MEASVATHEARAAATAAPAAADVGFAALNISADASSFSSVVVVFHSDSCELWQLRDGQYYVKKERGRGGPLG